MKKLITFFITLTLIITTVAFPVKADGGAVLNISAKDNSRDISDKLYGLFIEDISYACDGGLVSNLVNNNSFEYAFNKTTGWTYNNLDVSVDDSSLPMGVNNPSYATIKVNGKGSLTNIGFTEMYDYKTYDRNEIKAQTADMGFKADTEYNFSCYINNRDFEGTVSVYLDSPTNKANVTELDTSRSGNVWTQLSADLTAVATEDGALTIEFNGTGTICLDFVNLVPKDSYGYGSEAWKYTSLRPDLYESLKRLNSGFVRFPGGCLAEGDSLENLYDWKSTIGPLEERKQSYNLWRDDYGRDYINTNSMGYHEYFQLCDDLNAKPIPIVNAGLTCQGRANYDNHAIAYLKSTMTDAQWQEYMTNVRNMPEDNVEWRDGFTADIESLNINSEADWNNYLATIALTPGTKEWDAYVQDILDLIEYANGDATTTYWGALRAANGSVKPFNLEYIGIGNENWGEVYERNFRELYKAVKAAYPEITVVSSAGAWLDGDAFDENWKWINEDFSDTVVDEHYYTQSSYLFSHNDRYDSYDRNGAHVFIGEYAATSDGTGTLQTKSNMYEAVEEASYLTGIERNGDIVDMISYAPTFAKVNAQCWTINMIWFDSQEIVLTPSYYVQQLFSNNYGTKYLESTFENGETIQDGIYESVTLDESAQTLYVKLVNTTGKAASVNVNLSDFGDINRVSAQSISADFKSATNEIGKNTTYPVEKDLAAGENITVDMGKYDVTVVRVAYGSNDGGAFYTLPGFIDDMPKASGYLPPALRVAIPCGIAAVVVIVAVAIAVSVIIKKKKSRKNEK